MVDWTQAVDAVHATFGVPVVVQETIPRTIRAVRRAPDDLDRIGGRDVLSRTVLLEIRAADMTGIVAGTRLLVGGAMREVRGVPEYLDADRLVAVVNTVPIAS